jgi:RNA polymerase sigma factor (TIGR02999 family)
MPDPATPEPAPTVTQLLQAIEAGDDAAHDRLFELLHGELRQVAGRQVANGPPRATIQATALVSEAYLRLLGRTDLGGSRNHFFFAVARAMRDVLVEDARRKAALRRGGDLKRVSLDDVEPSLETHAERVLALDDALERIAAENPRRADIVRLRFYAGLTEAETAETLATSVRTVSREWREARAELAMLMSPGDGE